jgi:hypothetical protein
MNATADHLVDRYLKHLEAELGDLTRARRRELVEEISEHIVEARASLATGGEAGVRTLLDRLGDPSEIAAEARERFGVQPRKRGWLEPVALVLLLIGGVILPIVGWFAGLVLLWASQIWTTRDKLIGTFVVPGGLAPAFYYLFAAGYDQACVSEFDPVTNTTTESCTGGPSDLRFVLGIVIFAVLVLGPIATTAYLSRRMKRRSHPLPI